MSANSGVRLIVGLGNPGKEYENTRHNVGFMVLDGLLRGRSEWRWEGAWNALVASWDGAIFCKPQTYMNLSGRSVAGIARFFKIPVEAILVVSDDMALSFGKLRIRLRGSAGGRAIFFQHPQPPSSRATPRAGSVPHLKPRLP